MSSPRDSAPVGGAGSVGHSVPTRGGPTDPSHDRDLRRGVLRTTVSRPVAGFLALAFLVTIYAVPVTQIVMDKRNGEESVLPDLFARWPTRDTIKQFEEDLEKASSPREWIKPRLQSVLTRIGGFGNTKAIVGRKGWLFYQPGVAAIGGPGLLDSSIIESRIRAARDAGEPPLFPDPRPAILEFRAYLAGRGINLVLLSVPDKAALQPMELRGPRAADAARPPAANPDYGRLLRELRAAGVWVFDPTPELLDPRDPPRFLRQDTHWTPAWMEQVAATLARFVVERKLLGPPPVPRAWTAVEKTVSRVGDLVDMLGLPAGQTAFLPQVVSAREIRNAAGGLFEPERRADVLLLGDSFCNVFTLGQMGWGEAAGLGPHLARALGRDIDIIAQNDAGAHATRQLLRNEVSADGGAADSRQQDGTPGDSGDRLSGKKLVIWEFAARELAVGNWKPIAWPRPVSAARPAPRPLPAQDEGAGSTGGKGQTP